jgi:hypothetical protein
MSDYDETEAMRRAMSHDINSKMKDRAMLEEEHGEVWDTEQLTARFNVQSFLAPFVMATDRQTGRSGSLMFQHWPRFYWGWKETGGDEPIEPNIKWRRM